MTNEQRIKNLSVPRGNVDVVLDTDAYNEIDDQFAISLKMVWNKVMMMLTSLPFPNRNLSFG